MAHISEAFGKEVKKRLDERGWSHLRANVATGIPSATIGRMALGIVPGEDHVIKWAKALNESINYWLDLAGYEPIPANLICETKTPYRVAKSSSGDDVCIPIGAEPSQEDIDKIAAILQHGAVKVEDRKSA
jgi:transcriptional regulator with XRE-family HTH domain